MSLRLRRPERDDLDVAVDWMTDPVFQEFLYGGDQRVPGQSAQLLLALVGGALTLNINPAGHLLVESSEAGVIGIVAFHDMAWRNRSCTAAIYVASEHRTERSSAETYTAAIVYAFDELNLHRVSVRVNAPDAATVAILDRLGATREVTLRGHAIHEGAACDVYEYGLLRAEHEARRPTPSVGTVGAAHGA